MFTYDAVNEQYKNGNDVLLPTIPRVGVSQPETVSATSFYGLSGGSANNNNFQWDGQTTLSSHYLDVDNMFVSPVNTGVTWCQAMQYGHTGTCSSNQNTYISFTQNPEFAYPTTPNTYGPHNMYTGQDLIPAVNVSPFGNKRVSQQALNTDGLTMTYCVATYGEGWRVPTDIEVGRPDSYKDNDGGNGTAPLNLGYKGTSNIQMWTSAYGCQSGGTTCYPYYRHTYRLDNSSYVWPWSNGQLTFETANGLRCVYAHGN